MRDFLRHVFVEDALLKGASLVLAVVLFVAVRGDKDAAMSAYVKVAYVLPKDRVLVSEPPSEVRVSVRGPWTRVSRLEERDLEPVRIDLAKVSAGDIHFDDLVHLPVGLRVASISPASARLQTEVRVERTVSIQPILEGEPAVGYRVARSAAHPRDIKISGAKSVIDKVQRVSTRPFRIADARASVRGPVRLEGAPPHAQFLGSDEVILEVEVVPALAERTMKGVAVRTLGSARMATSLEPNVADVVLRGPVETIAGVPANVPSLLVDVQAEDGRSPGTFRKRISVVGLPHNVAAEVRPPAVTVTTYRRRN